MKNLHLFLLIGQSNMSSRAAIGPKDSTDIPGAWLLKSQTEWVPAFRAGFPTSNGGFE